MCDGAQNSADDFLVLERREDKALISYLANIMRDANTSGARRIYSGFIIRLHF